MHTHIKHIKKAQAFPHVSSYRSSQCNEGEKGFGYSWINTHMCLRQTKRLLLQKPSQPDTDNSGLHLISTIMIQRIIPIPHDTKSGDPNTHLIGFAEGCWFTPHKGHSVHFHHSVLRMFNPRDCQYKWTSVSCKYSPQCG